MPEPTSPPTRLRRPALLSGAVAAIVAGSGALAVAPPWEEPKADRTWAADQAVAVTVTRDGDALTIHGVRDFVHRPDAEPETVHRTAEVDLAEVRGVWMVLAPFAERWRGLAHAFVSFELEDGRFLAVSVEARREADESYSLVGGVTRDLELMYVVGTEADLIGSRALRGDTLFLYPTRAEPAAARALLTDMLERADRLARHPEFYNTLTNNCVTNLRDHVNRVAEGALPWGWGVLLPGFSDELALEHGLLATDLPIDEARRRFRADEAAREALLDPDGRAAFSARIRGRSEPPPP